MFPKIGQNQSNEQVSATSHEVTTSRYYVVYAACNNGELALVRSNPEIVTPVTPPAEVQSAPRLHVAEQPNPLLWTNSSLEPAPVAAEEDMGDAARRTIAEIHGLQPQPNLRAGIEAEEQYGKSA